MTVKELRELLAKADDNDLVVLAKDSEGNSYSPLDDGWLAVYVPECKRYGEVYLRELTKEDRAQGYTEEDTYDGDDGVLALVLWPVN